MDIAVHNTSDVGGVVRHTPESYCEAHPTCANTPSETMAENIRTNAKLGLPNLYGQPPNGGHVVIVGGGVSVKDHLAELKFFHKNQGHEIIAINGMGKFLHDKGITPDVLLMLDARPGNQRFLDGVPPSVECLLASIMDPNVIRTAMERGHDVTLWHTGINGDEFPEIERPYSVVRSTANSAGLLAILVAGLMGFKHIHLYGFDSCYRSGEGHPYPQPENDGEEMHEITVGGNVYEGPLWMLFQAARFPAVVRQAQEHFNANVYVHGPGLIRAYADEMNRKARQDLGEHSRSNDQNDTAAA